jgi:23S rRNA pseudouridine1911/1915/1917 synthase
MSLTARQTYFVAANEVGLRLDAYLAKQLGDHSRSYIANLIRQGSVLVDGIPCKPAYKLKPNQSIQLQLPEPVSIEVKPEPMELEVLFEDESMIVLNKAAGVVVHPAAGHATGTLVHGLLHHCQDLEGIGGEKRPGIVHRLDKDTSGVLLVAKNDAAHHSLTLQFKKRSIKKKYIALVAGALKEEEGCIDLPVGRHPQDRKKMSTFSRTGRSAVTCWQVSERLSGATLLDVDLKTGRTHQIRVHCQIMGHPIIGDYVYGKTKQFQALTRSLPQAWEVIKAVRRQMLHACEITLVHPKSKNKLTFRAPLAADMTDILDRLRHLKTL